MKKQTATPIKPVVMWVVVNRFGWYVGFLAHSRKQCISEAEQGLACPWPEGKKEGLRAIKVTVTPAPSKKARKA